MVLLIIFTVGRMFFVLYQFLLIPGQGVFTPHYLNAYGPLIKFLPQTLANGSRGGNAVSRARDSYGCGCGPASDIEL